MLDKRQYVYSEYSFELLEHWVKVQNSGDCIYFPVMYVKEVVEFDSKFQEALIGLGLTVTPSGEDTKEKKT